MSELEEAVARLERAIARLEAAVDPARRATAERVTSGATAIAERVDAALARLAQLLEEDG
jgi:exonuclease VII small subunit